MNPALHSVLRVATLGLIAGYVDAVGYVELHGIYSAAMTENSTTFGVSLARHDWGRVASVGTVLGLFFMGALGAAIVRRSLRQWRYEWLWIAALLLLAQFVHWSHAANASSRAETLFLTVAMAMQGKCCRAFPAHPCRPSSSRTTSLSRQQHHRVLWGLKDGKWALSPISMLPGLGWGCCIAGAFLSVPAQDMTSAFSCFPSRF
ncbi:YoaK family protein [Komagataeibacter rhaeticus]|nr:YoaK family protein [Komagataeibacter rhaeticus]